MKRETSWRSGERGKFIFQDYSEKRQRKKVNLCAKKFLKKLRASRVQQGSGWHALWALFCRIHRLAPWFTPYRVCVNVPANLLGRRKLCRVIQSGARSSIRRLPKTRSAARSLRN